MSRIIEVYRSYQNANNTPPCVLTAIFPDGEIRVKPVMDDDNDNNRYAGVRIDFGTALSILIDGPVELRVRHYEDNRRAPENLNTSTENTTGQIPSHEPTQENEATKPTQDNEAAKPTQDNEAAKPTQDNEAAKPTQDNEAAKPTQDNEAAKTAQENKPRGVSQISNDLGNAFTSMGYNPEDARKIAQALVNVAKLALNRRVYELLMKMGIVSDEYDPSHALDNVLRGIANNFDKLIGPFKKIPDGNNDKETIRYMLRLALLDFYGKPGIFDGLPHKDQLNLAEWISHIPVDMANAVRENPDASHLGEEGVFGINLGKFFKDAGVREPNISEKLTQQAIIFVNLIRVLFGRPPIPTTPEERILSILARWEGTIRLNKQDSANSAIFPLNPKQPKTTSDKPSQDPEQPKTTDGNSSQNPRLGNPTAQSMQPGDTYSPLNPDSILNDARTLQDLLQIEHVLEAIVKNMFDTFNINHPELLQNLNQILTNLKNIRGELYSHLHWNRAGLNASQMEGYINQFKKAIQEINQIKEKVRKANQPTEKFPTAIK